MTSFPLRQTSPHAARLKMRELLAAPEVVVFPGPYDASSAILLKDLGFDCLWAGGYLGSATSLGAGDLAFMGMTEQLRFATSIVEATGLPVLADCDDGFGGVLQVARTVQAFERAGVAAMQIEDQAAPKHCAFYKDFPLLLIKKEEMVAKVKTALDARVDGSAMIWARCDAIAAGLGVGETLDRINAYAEAGADAIFVPSTDLSLLAEYASQWTRPEPLVMSGTAFQTLTLDQIKKMGFSGKVDPFAVMLAALQAVEEVMVEYRRTGTLATASARSKTFKQFEKLLDIDVASEMDTRYSKATV
jgi:2-methylisocitrate lyase-like PEP mutase family enzyme